MYIQNVKIVYRTGDWKKNRKFIVFFLLLLQMLQLNFIFQESGFTPEYNFLVKTVLGVFFLIVCGASNEGCGELICKLVGFRMVLVFENFYF